MALVSCREACSPASSFHLNHIAFLLRCSSAVPEALGADACVAIDCIHTLGSMATLVSYTVIVVCLTQLSTVARDTFASGTQAERS